MAKMKDVKDFGEEEGRERFWRDVNVKILVRVERERFWREGNLKYFGEDELCEIFWRWGKTCRPPLGLMTNDTKMNHQN